MRSFSQAAFLFALVAGVARPTLADDSEAKAVIDKAIRAVGGEEKLARIKGFSEKGKGTILFNDAEIEFTFKMTALGSRQYRSEYEGEFGGTHFEGGTVLDGDKGWKKAEGEVAKLDGEKLAAEKRNAYLDVVPLLLLPLKGEGFKLSTAGEGKVDDKPAAVVRVVGPEGKDFTLFFDKESGLLVKMNWVAPDEQGEEDAQEQTFEDYKDFAGIKVATTSKIKRGGKRFIEIEGTEFRILEEAEPGTFDEPK